VGAAGAGGAQRAGGQGEDGGGVEAFGEEVQEATEDGGRRGAGERLVHDRAHQRGETVGACVAQVHRAGTLDEPRHRGVAPGDEPGAFRDFLSCLLPIHGEVSPKATGIVLPIYGEVSPKATGIVLPIYGEVSPKATEGLCRTALRRIRS